jgi:hypothetical protein
MTTRKPPGLGGDPEVLLEDGQKIRGGLVGLLVGRQGIRLGLVGTGPGLSGLAVGLNSLLVLGSSSLQKVFRLSQLGQQIVG